MNDVNESLKKINRIKKEMKELYDQILKDCILTEYSSPNLKKYMGHKLCYINKNIAWFTDSFEHQWGDDWNDSPYEHNAGEPYDLYRNEKNETIKIDLICIPYKAHYFETPCDICYNSSVSVEMINSGASFWLYSAYKKISINAGISLIEFISIIENNDGEIFIPFKWVK